jgi:hypothetical protein
VEPGNPIRPPYSETRGRKTMAFDYQIGGQDVEVEPIDPHTE